MRKGPQHNTASLLHIVLELLTALFESIFLLNSTKSASVMLAFSIVLHTVRLIRGELTFCHKLLRRFCGGGGDKTLRF